MEAVLGTAGTLRRGLMKRRCAENIEVSRFGARDLKAETSVHCHFTNLPCLNEAFQQLSRSQKAGNVFFAVTL